MGKVGNTELYWEDILVIVIYFLLVLAVGLWSSYKSIRDSVSGYFLANRSMHWIPVGASLFASNIGSGHFIGLAGSGASSGIGIAAFELNALYILLVLGWLFVPVYMASGVYTMPEYLRKRFGGQRIRIYLSVLALLLYVFTKISADLYAGAIFINQSIKLELYSSVLTLLVISALFTISGGLTAVMWTDSAQTVLMLIGAFVLMILSFIKVGGYTELLEKFAMAQPNDSYIGYGIDNKSCSLPPENYNHLLRSASDPELPWTGITFGLTISAVWYWCSDQVIVQRALSARSMVHAKAGCILAGYLKLTPLFLLVLPGMAARILFPDIVACSDPEKCEEACGIKTGCTNVAYPMLVLKLMPAGARGMMLSVMLAALMSSLTSIFNSSSTIFTMDIWTRIRKHASEMELLIVGRVFVLILVAISIVWIPIIQASQGSQLFHYIQSVTSYLAPPVCAVYVLAILWSRINEKGAFWGLMIGLVIGMIRFVMEFAYTVPACAENLPDPRPAILSKIHYLHFGCILFVIVCIATSVISLLTEPIAEKHLYRLTFWSRLSPEIRDDLDTHSTSKAKTAKVSDGAENPGFQEVENGISIEMSLKSPDIQQNKEINQPQNDIFKPEPTLVKRAFYFVCGLSENLRKNKDQEVERLSPEDEAKRAVEFMKSNPFWDTISNGNAVFLLIVASFAWGYYA
ncbi:sodium/glucose cotransporter 4-like [Centruroides vittatus]|uniref:sodium/glucose cotransporter 4-like n=1 Tax=Centruroides vittatus TaxID=120091 RepID=UPI00350FA429